MDDQQYSVEEAKRAILNAVVPLAGRRMLAIREALDQVLAIDITSPIDVPAHDNSAMDGYALRGTDICAGEVQLEITGTAFAGKQFEGEVRPGQCVRIMTGAVMPQGCDTVVIQENCQVTGQQIVFNGDQLRAGDNRRLRGEDLSIGKTALPAGKLLRPADLGLLASLGIAEVPVKPKLRVAFFSTGDELRSLGQVLDTGCVYDSNRYTLYGMLTRLRCIELIDMGVVPDNPEALEQAICQACDTADVILTSGGVSVGEADFTKEVMGKLGQVNFWKIAMRPGRPMAFGQVGNPATGRNAVFFGLPGNPVAVMVTFYAFVRDALLAMAGAQATPVPLVSACMAQAVRKRPGRTEYQRVKLHWEAGKYTASLTGAQGSGVLRSMSESDGLLVLEHSSESLKAGDWGMVIPFEGLV